MVRLNLKKKIINVTLPNEVENSFKGKLIFYTMNKKDKSHFFLNFILVDFEKGQIIHLDSYTKDNIDIIMQQANKEIFVLQRTPHRSVPITENKDFLTFIQEESYFFYVNYLEDYLCIYTFSDFISEAGYEIKKISSTFYTDPDNLEFIYISAIDNNNVLHIYHMSLDLTKIVEIFSLENLSIPPHTIRKHLNKLFVSHDFGNAQFKSLISDEILSSKQLALAVQKKIAKKKRNDNYVKSSFDELYKAVLEEIFTENQLESVPGEILVIALNDFQLNYYKTNGTSPAHFEIDEKTNSVYVSSHNFFVWQGKNIYVMPAVIDKFEFKNDSLDLKSSFSCDMGYRFTSHKVFYNNNQAYICTFAHPNRLLIVDAETMTIDFYMDINEDELSKCSNIRMYLNSRASEFEIISIETSKDGNYITFVDKQFVYIFDVSKKAILCRLDYLKDMVNKDDYSLLTAHIDYI